MVQHTDIKQTENVKTEDPLTATLLDRRSGPINLEPKESQDPIDTNFGDRQTYAHIIQDDLL